MATWYNEVVSDLSKMVDAIAYYEDELNDYPII